MKKPVSKKVVAAITMAAMTMSMAACGDSAADTSTTDATPSTTDSTPSETTPADSGSSETTPAEEPAVSPYTLLTDADGNPLDLGGIEIIIHDYWGGDIPRDSTATSYEEALNEYRDWIEETYNCTIKESQEGDDWGTIPETYINYVTSGGDDTYQIFAMRDDQMGTLISSGLCYDLATLDIDFSQDIFQMNKTHEMYSKGGSIYGMFWNASEPRNMVWFNKTLLEDAGIDPQELYDLQDSGEWTWDKFREVLEKVQRDTDGDGELDVYGLGWNGLGAAMHIWAAGNGGDFIGVDSNGDFVNGLNDSRVQEAMEYARDIFNDFYGSWYVYDAEINNWNEYQTAFTSGKCAFLVEEAYIIKPGNLIADMDNVGCVYLPKNGDNPNSFYTTNKSNNVYIIPSCYDAEKAQLLADVYQLYFGFPEGWEGYNRWYDKYSLSNLDEKSLEFVMDAGANGSPYYENMIPDFSYGEMTYSLPYTSVSETVETWSGVWDEKIKAANELYAK